MVKQPTISRRNGVRDYLLVRLSALVLASWVLFLFGYLLCHPQLDYLSWKGLFAQLPMKVFTLLALVSILVHAWNGLWQMITDYLKCTSLRAVALAVVSLLVLGYFGAGLLIVWGV